MQYILLPAAVFIRHTASAEYSSNSTLRPARRLEQDFLCGTEECYINLVWDEAIHTAAPGRVCLSGMPHTAQRLPLHFICLPRTETYADTLPSVHYISLLLICDRKHGLAAWEWDDKL
jgi:hypothetical protein